MPLVDYASDSDASSAGSAPDTHQPPPDSPPRKKPRTEPPRPTASHSPVQAGGRRTGTGAASAASSLPPLPASFHDLYASTVRTATRDDPALHQGRVRQNPHIPGNWPSHVYIEWRPPSDVHALLTELVSSLQEQLLTTAAPGSSEGAEITSFLTSDLAAPQPLHISLSRPLALSSEQKDAFLGDLEAAIKASGIPRFTVACSKAEWHRTPESGRSFLVLRVQSTGDGNNQATAGMNTSAPSNSNPELTGLLRLCNATAEQYGQPGLYLWAENNGGDGGEEGEERVGRAFHVSIAWSFAEPTDAILTATERVFCSREATRKIQQVRIPIGGVKIKIGNVITHAALRDPDTRARSRRGGNLLGL